MAIPLTPYRNPILVSWCLRRRALIALAVVSRRLVSPGGRSGGRQPFPASWGCLCIP